MKRILVVMIITFASFWNVVALELKVEGSFLVGSYPNDICWLSDDVIAMGSSNGFHVFNYKTQKHDILFSNNHTYIRLSDDRDGFVVFSSDTGKKLYFISGRILSMKDAILLYQSGKLPMKYFKNYYHFQNVTINLDAATITVHMKSFEESESLQVIPIEGFNGTIITKRDIPETSKQVENDPIPWTYQKGVNTLHDYFDFTTGNTFAQVGTPIFSLIEYDNFSKTMLLRFEHYVYRVQMIDKLGYVSQLKISKEMDKEHPSFDWMVPESSHGLVSLTKKAYITRDWTCGSMMLGEEDYYPICLKKDDGTLIQTLKTFLLDSSIPVWVNWNRTRIAAICQNTDIKESCIAIFSVIRDGVVNDSSVRIRSGSGLDGKVLQVLTKGEAVKILDYSKDQETIEGITAYWCKVSTSSGKEGWVFGAFVDCID